MYTYSDFAKAVYAELKPEESFEDWDGHTFYSSEAPPPEMTVCERVFKEGEAEYPYILAGKSYILLQLSCTDGAWEVFTSDEISTSVESYANEQLARAAWAVLLGE